MNTTNTTAAFSNTRHQAASVALALVLTLGTLAGVNQLATKDVGDLQMAAAAASAPAAATKS